jgi:hypothetical protein
VCDNSLQQGKSTENEHRIGPCGHAAWPHAESQTNAAHRGVNMTSTFLSRVIVEFKYDSRSYVFALKVKI